MSEDFDFIFKYVDECIAEGSSDPNSICELALKEIEELEKEIDKADIARVRKMHLTRVLKHFHHKSVFKVRNSKISPVANVETANAVLSSATDELMAKICEYVETHEECTASDILQAVGDYKHNEATYSSIKILCERDIIQQKDRKIFKGDKWDDKYDNSKNGNST